MFKASDAAPLAGAELAAPVPDAEREEEAVELAPAVMKDPVSYACIWKEYCTPDGVGEATVVHCNPRKVST